VGLVILFLCFAPWFFWFIHFRALFSLQTTAGPVLILRLIKHNKKLSFRCFVCFCFPLLCSFAPPFISLGYIRSAQAFLFHRTAFLFRWFRLHFSGSLMRASEDFHTRRSVASITTSGGYHHREPNTRTERQRRYHIRRKIRFRCRLEAAVYLRFLYERCA
jgi:hypothetical protein